MSGGADVTITPSAGFTTWDVFFSNTDISNCPITSCTIADSGDCDGTLSGTEAGYFSFDSASPWGLQTSVDVVAGFTKSLCIECTNGDDFEALDGWSITQSADLCANTLSAGTGTADVTLTY